MKKDDNRFNYGRNGDHLVTTFLCDYCIFYMLKQRNPLSDNAHDKLLLITIRRMNLDALWSREPSTVSRNLSSCDMMIKMLKRVDLQPDFEPLGPFPNKDILGIRVAIAMLQKSLEPGKYADYTQFETMRKFRSVSSNQYLASISGCLAAVSIGKAATKQFMTNAPTQTLWFEKFSHGCLKRMGQIIKRDLAISIDVMLALINQLKLDIQEATGRKKIALIQCAVYSIIAFCGSFRGNEAFLVDLDGLNRYYKQLEEEKNLYYVIVPLMGRFKGETGERYHLTPLAAVTNSGIRVRAWIGLLLKSLGGTGRMNGPAFGDSWGQIMSSTTMETMVLDTLVKVQTKHPSIIPAEVDVHEEYGISRSFRRGATTHARNQGVSQSDIDAANRWRNVENAQGRKINQPMRDHYSEVKQMTPTLLRFSQAL